MSQTAESPGHQSTAIAVRTGVHPKATSTFVNGHFPRRRLLVIVLSALAGFLLTVLWSAEFVDRTIGDNVVDTMLGHEARDAPLNGITAGIAFAFASGVAGTFTACNVAAFGALTPVVGQTRTARGRVLQTLRPVGWLSAGMITLSATYGAIVALVGTRMPQFQTATVSSGWSPRMIQSMVVFGIIGLIMIYLGLASLGVVPDPMARISARFPNAPMVLMGVLIGGFLIGRPFALFRQMFRDAAEDHNVLYGIVAFSLQSIGNIVIITVFLFLMALVAGSRLQNWIAARPSRASAVVAAAFIVAGVFTVLYWDVRILERRGMIWYPLAPWA